MKGAVVFLLLMAATASAQAARGGQRCLMQVLNVTRDYSQRDVFNNNSNINYDAAGDVRLRCAKQQIFLNTDSMSALSGDYIRLYGHAVYRDSAYRFSADTMVYIIRTEKLEARGHVNVLDQNAGSTLAGPYVDYWRQVKGINDSAKVVALLHPTVRYYVPSAPADTAHSSPYILSGQMLQGFGESRLWGSGAVTIDRDSLHGTGDSLAFERGATDVGQLIGTPATLRRAGADSFAVSGREIRLGLADDKIRDLRAFGDGRVARGASIITGDTVLLSFAAEKLSLTLAWARKTRATLKSSGYDVRGDSLAVESPGEQLREVRVFRDGMIQNPRDTALRKPVAAATDSAPADSTRNTLWGDRLVVRFDQLDSAGTLVTRLRRLQAFGNARSLFSRTVVKNGRSTPSINYIQHADTLLIVMKSGDSTGVSSVRAHGHVNGVQLETASVRKQPDSTRARVSGVRP